MPELKWLEAGKHIYETGCDHGVLFLQNSDGSYANGQVWDGLTSVDENPTGGESNPQYADNTKYLDLYSAEEFGATVNCFHYPDDWAKCDGSAEIAPGVYIGMQNRVAFGMSYRTLIGNEIVGTDYGFKIHLLWGGKAQPSDKTRSTVNDNPEATEMSYEVTTTPVGVTAINPDTGTAYKPTSYMCIDSTKVDKEKMASFLKILWGSEDSESRLLSPDEVIAHFKSAA